MSDTEDVVPQDFWQSLRLSTQSRIGLGRTGDSLPTRRVLEFKAAHAAARDAVHEPLDVEAFAARVTALGIGEPIAVTSMANGRSEYLRRPDLGRKPADLSALSADQDWDIGLVLADGLSPRALADHGVELVAAIVEELAGKYSIAPPVVATEARVALGDSVAEAMGVTTVLVLIGERPGLSVADSLGVYLTHLPKAGMNDADRNCVSNIHPPDGLGYSHAAKVVAGLIGGARALGRSGVDLKDTSRGSALGQSVRSALD